MINRTSTPDKNSQQTRNGKGINLIKGIYIKKKTKKTPTANIILHAESESFLFKIKNKTSMSLVSEIRQEKRNRSHPDRKGRSKTIFTHRHDHLCRKSNGTYKKS